MKKKTLELGRQLGIIALLKTPGFQKIPVINPLQALVHPQTQKETILHGLSIPNPNFSETAFSRK
jgi:hypothetical protein